MGLFQSVSTTLQNVRSWFKKVNGSGNKVGVNNGQFNRSHNHSQKGGSTAVHLFDFHGMKIRIEANLNFTCLISVHRNLQFANSVQPDFEY